MFFRDHPSILIVMLMCAVPMSYFAGFSRSVSPTVPVAKQAFDIACDIVGLAAMVFLIGTTLLGAGLRLGQEQAEIETETVKN